MSKKNLNFLLVSFLVWRMLLFAFLFLALSSVPHQFNFLGGGLDNYLSKPYFWAWANFDGEHYLSIAYRGYQPLTYFYLPVFPLLTRAIASLFNQSFISFVTSGFLISHLAFFIGLVGLMKLIDLDFSKKITRTALLLLLLFPTSYYFGSFYTESLFFALSVWSFYFARKSKWLSAGLLGAVSTATRVVGLVLFPALLVELWLKRKSKRETKLLAPLCGLLFIPLGLLAYMYYLKTTAGDPLEFVHSVSIFGEQRSAGFVLLPQVFYRYFFKILPNINFSYFPAVFTVFLELSVALLFSLFTVVSFFRLRTSYAFYLAFGFLIPTLSGSFSSLPRYVLILFPAYILVARYLYGKPRFVRLIIFIILFISLGIATSLFVRGYWVS